jgi:RNA polymerase sigma-70 factor (sigma-E family)
MGDRTVGIDAFEVLFEQHREWALRLAYVLSGDASSAEDVVADAFARMYPRFRRGVVEDPVAYLRSAIVNQVRGRFRRLGHQRRHEQASRREPSPPGIDVTVAQREDLRLALLELPPRQRAAIVLRHLEDLSEAQTAALLGITTGTVKSSVARGLERLRQVLDSEDDAP